MRALALCLLFSSLAFAAVPPDYPLLDGARQGQYVRYGQQGPIVLALQHALNAVPVRAPVNSDFDTATLVALRTFQQNSGIPVDGVVGPQTMGAFDRALGVPQRGIPPRPRAAPTGSAFIAETWNMTRPVREAAILNELLRGNIPDFERTFANVTVSGVGPDGVRHSATYRVMPDYIAIGTDRDFVRIPINPMTGQRVADAYGCSLPTRKMVRDTWREAVVKLAPSPMPPGPQMMSNDYFIRHQRTIEAQRAGRPLGLLLSGDKKDVVISNLLLTNPTRVAIFGWYRLSGVPIQPLSTVHENTYADYSHGVRMTRRMVTIDGVAMDIVDVLRSPVYSYLLSDEGRMPSPRIPGVPER